MKRYLLAALVGLMVTPGAASAHMMGWNDNNSAQTVARHEMRPQVLTSGMMTRDTGTTGGCMMQGGMMGSETTGYQMQSGMMGDVVMPAAIPPPTNGMMAGWNRDSTMIADGMMAGQFDLERLRTVLNLSDEQADRLRADVRSFQKDEILSLASLKVAEFELADLLAADTVQIGKVEAKLNEIEGLRSKARLTRLKTVVAVRGVLGTEQLAMLQGNGGCHPEIFGPATEPRDVAPQSETGHHMHH